MSSTVALFAMILIASLMRVDAQLQEMYAWKSIDYTWSTPEDRAQAIADKSYIPENNALIGVKLWKGIPFVNVARWLPGVPSTLNFLPEPYLTDSSPLSTPLTPFPSWEMQEEGNCSAIQYIQGMEIDTMGRLWALDVGRRNFFTSEPDNTCPPKLLLLDIKNGGTILRTFIFPEAVVSRNDSFLNDLVVQSGPGLDWYAYISDAKGGSGAIVVYSLQQNAAWRVEDEKSMKAEGGEASMAMVGGRSAKLTANVDGIALAPLAEGAAQVFYSPLGSFNLYSIPTQVLRNPPSDPSVIAASVTNYGKRTSQGDGMMMDYHGNLYFGLLGQDAFAVWSGTSRLSGVNSSVSEAMVVAKDLVSLQWVDGFGINNDVGDLWLVSNRLQNLQAKDINLNETNYRLLRTHIGTKSYMYNPGA